MWYTLWSFLGSACNRRGSCNRCIDIRIRRNFFTYRISSITYINYAIALYWLIGINRSPKFDFRFQDYFTFVICTPRQFWSYLHTDYSKWHKVFDIQDEILNFLYNCEFLHFRSVRRPNERWATATSRPGQRGHHRGWASCSEKTCTSVIRWP